MAAARVDLRTRVRDAVLPWLDRHVRSGGILSYHAVVEGAPPSPEMHISADRLRTQLEYLTSRYTIVPLRELVLRHQTRRSTHRCVAITFDDAYVGLDEIVATMVAEFDIPVTVFVTTAAAECGAVYWWDRLDVARRHDSPDAWDAMLDELALPRLVRDAANVAAVRDHVLGRRSGRWSPAAGAAAIHPLLRSLDFAGLRRLASDDRFDFGCHTVTHPALALLAPFEQELEMREAHRTIREQLPHATVPIVAYPYGVYDRRTMDAARRAGLRAGVTMQGRALGMNDDVFALPRLGVSEDWSPAAIGLRINAAGRLLQIARSRGIHPRMPIDPLPAAERKA